MAMLPGQTPFNLYQQIESVDMNSAPGLSHSGPMAGDSDTMEMDSRPLEAHHVHIQAHRMQLQTEQNRRQQQQAEHQGLQTQQRLAEQRPTLVQQEYPAFQQHPHQPSVPRSMQQQERRQQGQQHWHGFAPATEASYETGMPSLCYSEDHSTSSMSGSQSGTQMAPRQAYVQYFQGPGLEADRPDLGGGNVWMQAGATGLDGPDQDHEYFFASMTNTTAPNVTPLAYFEMDEFLNLTRLTKGGNGEIQQAYWPAKKSLVILKSLLSKHSVAKSMAMFDKEVEVMHRCRDHDNIVKFYGVATRKQYAQDLQGQEQHPQMRIERHMVMNFYEHGDLASLITRRSRTSPVLQVALVDKLYLAMDIALGLEHLLRCGFHHGDLHPKNILIDDRLSARGRTHGEVGRYQARLTDFGLRRIRDYKGQVSSQQFGGVWQFMAPERMCREVDRPRYDLACDIFALGVIYWFMMSGRYPFKEDPSAYTPGAREGRITGTPDWYYAVYSQAWSEDPKERQQDLQEIIRVFQLNLGIPTTQQSPVSPGGQRLPGGQTPYLSPPYSHDSPTYAPASATSEGTRAQHIYPGSPRGGSSMMTPTMVGSSAFHGDTSTSSLHSPGQSTATSTSSATRSVNPNHPRNKKATVPNGMQSRILQRPR